MKLTEHLTFTQSENYALATQHPFSKCAGEGTLSDPLLAQ